MKLISHDLRDGGKLPNRHVFNGMGYDGDNISPHLMWDDVPAGTKSFVVTCYDPDAPTGSGWWHWVVANLPADTRVLPQGPVPVRRSCRKRPFRPAPILVAGYGGAAPPKGETHRYIFTVHAPDVEKIEVDVEASGAMVGFNVHFASASITALASASITGPVQLIDLHYPTRIAACALSGGALTAPFVIFGWRCAYPDLH